MDKAEKVMRLAVRRGFFWPAYEIYGGVAGLLTWGPLGVPLKRGIAELWRKYFVERHEFAEIDSPNIAPYVVFKASGHVDSFRDIMVTCRRCGNKYRADTLLKERGIEVSEALTPQEMEEVIRENGVRCPSCGGELGDATYFMTMFKTTIGPYKEAVGFLRPETAQGMFLDFKRVYEIMRKRFPIGIAQIGRGFRNEISPRQGPIRLREFDMMELEMFIDPQNDRCPYLDEYRDETLNLYHEELIRRGGAEYETMTVEEALKRRIIMSEWMAYFMVLAKKFVEELGIPEDRQRFREKLEGERAHYATQTFDQEVYLSRWGWVEVSGHAYRGDYDLSAHARESGADMTIERRLEKPKVVVEVRVSPNAAAIRRRFPDKVGEIMRALSSDESWRERLLSDGYVEVCGVKLTCDLFNIRREERRVEVEKFVPHVVEPSFGLDRIAYAVLEYSYREREGRVVLSLPYPVVPYHCAVFPIVSKPEFVERALSLKRALVEEGYRVVYDDRDSIGRRYARVDEIGVPAAFTVDGRTLEDNTVTVRDRDTWRQYRLPMDAAAEFLGRLFRLRSFEAAARDMGLEPVEAPQ
ncbi:glycine--tRNA ligase [Candidatus Geothermarchaeota archaeon ex4572_27]|nr:MAG: glycine--tRNA ligase [Candidatus Geothermarchaeota archaeon ex4572_27]